MDTNRHEDKGQPQIDADLRRWRARNGRKKAQKAQKQSAGQQTEI